MWCGPQAWPRPLKRYCTWSSCWWVEMRPVVLAILHRHRELLTLRGLCQRFPLWPPPCLDCRSSQESSWMRSHQRPGGAVGRRHTFRGLLRVGFPINSNSRKSRCFFTGPCFVPMAPPLAPRCLGLFLFIQLLIESAAMTTVQVQCGNLYGGYVVGTTCANASVDPSTCEFGHWAYVNPRGQGALRLGDTWGKPPATFKSFLTCAFPPFFGAPITSATLVLNVASIYNQNPLNSSWLDTGASQAVLEMVRPLWPLARRPLPTRTLLLYFLAELWIWKHIEHHRGGLSSASVGHQCSCVHVQRRPRQRAHAIMCAVSCRCCCTASGHVPSVPPIPAECYKRRQHS